jgi:hypothetical protein
LNKNEPIDIEAWLKNGGHLPEVLKDFHDQKDIFKAMHEILAENPNDFIKRPSWIEGHCYVTDMFLTFMARRGYTLQRTRKRGKFRDLASDVREHNKRRSAAFASALKMGLPPAAVTVSTENQD